MLNKFWESLGEGLGGEWIKALLQPSLVFWGLGLLAWVQHHPDGWQFLLELWNKLGSTEARIAALVGILLGVMASSAVMRWVQAWLLRMMEGYWPRPFRRLRVWRTNRVRAKLDEDREEWQKLADPERQPLRPENRLEYIALDRRTVLYHPPQDEALMPTRLGNRLKAAEMHAEARYGLDAGVTWPRLWPLLPEGLQTDLGAARKALDATVRLFGWGILTCVWVMWAWWALPLGIAVAVVAWFRALDAAEVYGELIRAAFDLYRFKLYEAVRWSPPEETGEAERVQGERLTQYLFRGLTKEPVRFERPKE